MTFLTWLAAFAAGLLASMGVGGGMILIIWLTAVMGMSQIDAQGVNLIYFLPMHAALSVFIHRKNGLIDLKAMLLRDYCWHRGSLSRGIRCKAYRHRDCWVRFFPCS